MKGDDAKFFGSQQYEMNTKFGSYLQSTTCISLFCIPSNIESSESCFAQYLSLFELLSQKSWSRRLKKTSQRTFQSSESTTDLALYSVSKIDFKTSKSETVKSNYECLQNVKRTYLGALMIVFFCFVFFIGRCRAFNSSIESSITSRQRIKIDFFLII